MATAMASLTSTPGWWVPLETGRPSTGLMQQPTGAMISMESKNPSFLAMVGSTMEASWDTTLPRVLPKVDQAWISGRSSEPVKSTMRCFPSTVTLTCTRMSVLPAGSASK